MKSITPAEQKSQLKFGLQIRKYRALAHMTQQVLAKRASIYQGYIGRIESGYANPTLMVIVALALALAVPVDTLMAD
jgi:transcriptional regulator with XRE-family HTH domain